MSSQAFINEVRLFLKENKKYFFYTTSLFFILILIIQIGISLFTSRTTTPNVDENPPKPAEFQIYIENAQTGEPFSNPFIIGKYLNNQEWVNRVEQGTNVEISDELEKFESMEVTNTTESIKQPITAEINKASNIITLTFNIGEDRQNLSIANAYHDLMLSEQLNFLQNKTIYTVTEPSLLEEQMEIINTGGEESGNGNFSIINILMIVIISIIGGSLIGLVLLIVWYVFNTNIHYGFSYSWNEEDIYFNLPSDYSEKEITQYIVQPVNRSKVILSESLKIRDVSRIQKIVQHTDDFKDKISVSFAEDVSDLNPIICVEEFIFIVKRKETSKKWYNKQRELIKNYPESLIKIIQI